MTALALESRAGAARGLRAALPLGVGSAVFGVAFGVLARQAGLTAGQAVAMSALVFAGSSQMAVLGLWAAAAPAAAIVATALAVNLRHLLMGATLRPWFGRLPARRAYPALFFMTDETWSLTLRALSHGGGSPAYLVGSGMALFVTWVAGTAVGHAFGLSVADPAGWGLDFVATAAFAALVAGRWRGRLDLPIWTAAALAAVVAARDLPPGWHVVLGGLAGALAGALLDDD